MSTSPTRSAARCAACEGSLLVVDASQGVEAQTLANAYHAIDANHEIIPVLNKIDLPSADADRVCQEIEDVIGIDTSEAVKVSAKTGLGIDDLLEAMVKRLPPPKGDRNAPLEGAAGRQLVRPVPRRRHPGARQGRRAQEGHAHPHDGGGARPTTSTRSACSRPRPRTWPSWGRARSASSSPASRPSPTARSATPSPTTASPRPTCCRASSPRCRWCSAACSRPTPPSSSSCANRSPSSG